MKTLIVSVAILATTISAAANETATLLKSHRIPHALYVRVSGTDLQYALESPTNFVVLTDGDTFTSAETQVDFAYPQFNPFKIKIETSEDLRDDPTSAAVAALLQKVLDTAGTIVPPPSAPAAASSTPISAQTQQLLAMRATVENVAATQADCTAYNDLHTQLMLLRGKMNAEIVGAQDVRSWIRTATSAEGVDTTRQSIGDKIKAIDDNEKAIVALLKAINEKFGKAGSDVNTINTAFAAERPCRDIHASTFAALLDISQLASEARAKNLSVRGSLQDLNKAIEPFADPTRWRDGTSFIFLKPAIAPAKIDRVTVKVSDRGFDPDKLTFTDGSPIKKKLDLRQYQRIIPEVAAAMIYTDLTYPTWGTEDKGGTTVVAPGKPAKFPVQAAMMLNGVVPYSLASIYPAFQFGVSTAKDYPGFLAGFAIRNVGSKQFSLSIGKMLTWYRTLGTLHDGSVVTGTADIEKDMKLKRAPLAWYGGVQYSF